MATGNINGGVLAIVTAAGKAERMGLKEGKALVRLAGKPCLYFSLRVFDCIDAIRETVVVCPDGQEARVRDEAILPYGIHKVKHVLCGGATRQESVRAGIEYAKDSKLPFVLVHDAARPLIEETVVEQCIAACRRHGGAIAAIPVSETLKQGSEFVTATLRREGTWLAQTPQVFSTTVLWKAHEQAHQEGFVGTDEASLVERIGGTVAIVPGSGRNMKITYPEDLEIAEALLRR